MDRVISSVLFAFLLASSTYGHSTPDSKLLPPKGPDGEPVTVTVSLELVNFANLDLKDNELDVIAWPSYTWTDQRLAWDPKYKNNATDIRMPVNDIWVPDVVPYNAAKKPEVLTSQLVVVLKTGFATWVPYMRMRIMCDLAEVKTVEGANCSLKMTSWTYSGLDVILADNPSISSSNFFAGSRYDILSISAKRGEKKYSCCPETYYDIQFMFTIREKGYAEESESKESDESSSEEVDLVDGKGENNVAVADDDRDLAKEIERLVQSQIKKNKATVLTRSKGFTKSFIWQG